MTGRNRLHRGGRLNRAWPVHFTFNGRKLRGFPGDTLASALLANDVHFVARSFKLHRPRGIVTAGMTEPNALVRVGEGPAALPNARATMVPLSDGLTATRQNAAPSLEWDAAAVLDRLHGLLPAGFYYRRFLEPAWPRWPNRPWVWTLVEPTIRRLAGLGVAPSGPDPARYDHRFAQPQIAVIGAGPAGLMAALCAARGGARVLLAETDPLPGGSLLAEPWPGPRFGDRPADDWIDAAWEALADDPNVTLLPATTAVAVQPGGTLTLLERVSDRPDAPAGAAAPAGPDGPTQRLWHVRADHTILATGATERPIVFNGNDRPGIMLAGAVRAYMNRWAVLPGERAVIATATAAGYRLALDLADQAGAAVAIVDPRRDPTGPMVDRARRIGIDVLAGSVIAGTAGRHRVAGARVHPLDDAGAPATDRRTEIACDLIAMAGGAVPETALLVQAGGRLTWDAAARAFRPDLPSLPPGIAVAGAIDGAADWQTALAQGSRAAIQALAALALPTDRGPAPPATDPEAEKTADPDRQAAGTADLAPTASAVGPTRWPGGGRHRLAFVDLQADVTDGDLDSALTDPGFTSIEHVKRWTTAGMGVDQGRFLATHAVERVAESRGTDPGTVGFPMPRPPVTPIRFGAVAGLATGGLYAAIARGAFHDALQPAGAAFEAVAGQWRAQHLGGPGLAVDGPEEAAQIAREAAVCWTALALIDGGDATRLLLAGPDAILVLDRMIGAAVADLAPGQWRATAILAEDGFVTDLGRAICLAPGRYVLETGPDPGLARLAAARAAIQAGDLRATAVPLGDSVAAITLIGPDVPRALAALADDGGTAGDRGADRAGEAVDAEDTPGGSPDSPPPAAGRHWTRRLPTGGAVRVLADGARPVGQVTLWVDPADALAVWQRLAAVGGRPVGDLARDAVRIAAGRPRVGAETDGTVTPDDLDLGDWIAAAELTRPGHRALRFARTGGPGRLQLIGLVPADGRTALPVGGHLVPADPRPPEKPDQPQPRRTGDGVAPVALGHVTGSARHPGTGQPIALALMRDGRSAPGTAVTVQGLAGRVAATVTAPGDWPAATDAHAATSHAIDPHAVDPQAAATGPTAPPAPDDTALWIDPIDRVPPPNPTAAATVTPVAAAAIEIAVWDRPAFMALTDAPWPTPVAPAVGRSVAGPSGQVIALGPDRFLFCPTAPPSARDRAAIDDALADIGCALDRHAGSGQAGWGARDIVGPGARDVLATGCPRPLDAAAWPVGMGRAVRLGPLGIVLLRLPDRASPAGRADPAPSPPAGLAVLSPAAPELRPAATRAAAEGVGPVPAFRLWVAAGLAPWLDRWLAAAGASVADGPDRQTLNR